MVRGGESHASKIYTLGMSLPSTSATLPIAYRAPHGRVRPRHDRVTYDGL